MSGGAPETGAPNALGLIEVPPEYRFVEGVTETRLAEEMSAAAREGFHFVTWREGRGRHTALMFRGLFFKTPAKDGAK